MVIGVNAPKQNSRIDDKHITYRRTVASLCDHAIQSPQPNWRNPWQASHVDHVEFVSIQLGIRRKFILNCLTSAGYLGQAPADSALVACDTPLSIPPTESPSTCYSFASSTSSPTLVSPASSYSRHDVEMDSACANAPLTRSQSFTLIKQPDAFLPPPRKVVTYCPSCNAKFTGNYQNRNSNLRRHLKTVHHHGQPLCCVEPGCGKICGRSDNLRKHRRIAHNIEDPIRQINLSKRRRRSTELAD